ncbi:MAG TPA: c-type cytochrome [Rhodothermales bacterium]|nr:c-type cytochrome [Rhodothermales bacterium]
MQATATPCLKLVQASLLVLLIAACAVPPLFAQRFSWDAERENLTVLPEDISGPELRAVMQGFTQALGVRCEHCHDDSKGPRFSDLDFASDAKETKEITRTMMKMVRRINGEDLAEIDRPAEVRIGVTCITCHRGNALPITLEEDLNRVIVAEDVDAAIARYHTLRERYGDGFAYDFRVNTLNNLGYQLLGEDKIDEAIAIFRLNTEMYPQSSNAFDSLAEAYMKKGEPERAIALYQQSLVLNPNNDNAVEMLKQLKAKQ